jgi:hypothetical protein
MAKNALGKGYVRRLFLTVYLDVPNSRFKELVRDVERASRAAG